MTAVPPSASPTSAAPSPRRRTTQRVRLTDHAARVAITVGGVAVIVAILAIAVYLLTEAAPLFRSGEVGEPVRASAPVAGGGLALLADEYGGLAVVVRLGGTASVHDLATGRELNSLKIAEEGEAITAVSPPSGSGAIAVGFADGSVQIGEISFAADFLSVEQAPPELRGLAIGASQVLPDGSGYATMTPQRQLRRIRPVAEMGARTPLPDGTGAVRSLHYHASTGSQNLVAVRADGTAVFNTVSIVRPLGGGPPRTRLESRPVAKSAPDPDWVFATADANHIFMVWRDGTIRRFCPAADDAGFVAADTLDVTPAGGQVTAAGMLLGAKTLILGLSDGEVLGVFGARTNTPKTPDTSEIAVAHRMPGAAAASAVGISQRDRCFVVGDAAGGLTVRHMTSQKEVASIPAAFGAAGVALATLMPKLDGVLALSADGKLARWPLDPGHPEVSAGSLFGKVWYEGQGEPEYTYQSSSGEDTAETKFSLTPLIFGTIKATLYAMLFAVPVAILAAVYTSQLLHPTVRNTIKPVIEMMASLPSVVLGFLAAMVIAPVARDVLPSLLLAFATIPIGAVLAASVWQLMPVRIAARMTTFWHFASVATVAGLSIGAAYLAGPLLERALFTPTRSEVLVMAGSFEPAPRESWPEALRSQAVVTSADARRFRSEGVYFRGGTLVRPTGSLEDPAVAGVVSRDRLAEPSIRSWLDGTIGGPWPGAFLVLFPAAAALTVLLRARLVDPLLGSLPLYGRRFSAALTELVKMLLTLALIVGTAATMASATTAMGLDVRDSVFGAFSQRNTLIVAVVMGFAIIPIIYTISEDALSAVPNQLRSASLGCGATKWQTAVRVVLPIAMSGIFSACMIGLGRAAGETMIVLMATGNTPEMSWNIFSGFRTLAANIAVEMPEAPVASTHYRVLFVGAICLFGLTFVVNTAAELLRNRVRRRSSAL